MADKVQPPLWREFRAVIPSLPYAETCFGGIRQMQEVAETV